ncbi:SulP family inorganic anion transporter [Streptomyces qinzhouensis]|uniref:SulP family inorganic anion transporter n=2 Tax=Streptomyces qinzhouensis TaxID=2599401 RepID=A0A5B8JGI8_9ACTN|nr:SulP family inorganic anion transporter [Streptomyces qinzhouensis]
MASVVVFLVALPLCIGVAAASGVPVALGIITGIVGGLVVGFLPGSSLQVSGPAAGLAVLCLEFTTEHGVGLMGPVVMVSGILQMILGTLKMGRVFQSISLSVVQGMLAGIGVPLILSQTYALVDSKQHGTAPKNVMGLPDLVRDVLGDPQKGAALLLGAMAVVICFLWYKVPKPVGKVPAPLVAVMLGCVVAALPGFEVKKVAFGNMLDAVNIPGFGDISGLADPKVLMMVVTFTIIASAESLFSAAAVDRMHTGPRTHYNKELFAQGVGNTVSGALGAMPLTAVIVRSAANVNAGARTKISRILHGVWLLGFGLLLPGLLGLIPVSVLAGVLLHAGWKLFNPPSFVKMWKKDRGEGLVMFVTTGAIVATDLLDGVLGGLAVAVVLTALRMSHMTLRTTKNGDSATLELKGNATFLRLPKLIDALDTLAGSARVVVDGRGISHLDMACQAQLEEWADQRRKSGGGEVELLLPGSGARPAAAETAAGGAEDELTGTREQEPVREKVPAGAAAGTAFPPGLSEELAAGLPDPSGRSGPMAPPSQPDTYRPYAPSPQPGFSFQHAMGQGYAHGPVAHGTQYARHGQHHHPYPYPYGHQHPYPHGTHSGRSPGHGPQSQVHLAHPAHQMNQPHQPHPSHPGDSGHQPSPGPQEYGPYGEPVYPPRPEPSDGYAPPPQGYGPPAEANPGYWGPEDDWAVRAYGEGTRR